MFKNCKLNFGFGFGLCLLIVLFIWNSAFAKQKELKFIAKNVDVLIFINNNPEDPGLSFITNLWKERFEMKETPQKYEAIDQLYSEFPFGKIVGAAFLPKEAFTSKKEPIYPDFIVVIEVKGKREVFKKALDVLIKKRKPLKEFEYSGYKITYRDKALEPFHGEKDLAAYVQVGDFFVIATTPRQLEIAIDAYKGKLESITENREFLKLKQNLAEGDCLVFLNNENKKFSDNLKRWEEKEGMRLLLSSDLISSLGLSFDLETDDALKGEVIFMPGADVEIVNIEDDALFFAEVITRSFAKQQIKWISNVEATKDLVKLEFEGTGFKPILEEALLRKRIAFLEKEQKEKIEEEQKESIPEAKASLNNLPKIIFIILLALLILLFFLGLNRRKR
jgi:hypothetical protein